MSRVMGGFKTRGSDSRRDDFIRWPNLAAQSPFDVLTGNPNFVIDAAVRYVAEEGCEAGKIPRDL